MKIRLKLWGWDKYIKLESKPCGLGSRILGMEADMVNIFDLHGGC
jgi:hypothetical protein